MSQEVVLFHSGYGLRSAVYAFAAALRDTGHTVHTPDLFEGAVFTSLEEAVAYRDSIGIPELMRRAEASLADLPQHLVFAGFSMGTGPAGMFAALRPGARGAILMHGAFDPVDFGIERWPGAVPLQIHYARHDAEVDSETAAAMAATARSNGSRAEVFIYEGGGHLFSDPDLPDYDEASAGTMLQRALDFLASLDEEFGTS